MTTATLTNDSSSLPSILILPQNKLVVVFSRVVITKYEVMISELNPPSIRNIRLSHSLTDDNCEKRGKYPCINSPLWS